MGAQLLSLCQSLDEPLRNIISLLDHPCPPLGEGKPSRRARRGSQQAAHPYLGPFLSSEARETLFTRGTWRAWVSPLTHGTCLTSRTLRTESREKAVGVTRAKKKRRR